MISLIVCSYDGYSDCWDPYFTLLKKYFPESEKFDIILSTTTRSYEFEGLNIKTLAHGKSTPWGKRLKLSLEMAKYDIVVPMSEDYFLKSRVNFKQFEYFVDLFNKFNKIDYIRFLRYNIRWSGEDSEFKYLEEIDPHTKHRFLLIPGIWRKKVLNKYLKDYENVFMSEKVSGYRSWIYKDGFYSINNEFVQENGQLYNTDNSGFIFKGKWVPWGIDYLNSENLNIDYSKRGILTDNFIKKTRMKSKLDMFKTPIVTSRSVMSVFVLFLRSMFWKYEE